LLVLKSFFLYPSAVVDLLVSDPGFGVAHLDATFPAADGTGGLRAAVERLCDRAEERARAGIGILVLDDGGVTDDRAAVPALLATGAVHNRLVASGLRSTTSLVVQADDARDTHYIACLVGYGADAIC